MLVLADVLSLSPRVATTFRPQVCVDFNPPDRLAGPSVPNSSLAKRNAAKDNLIAY